ncbi:carboxypeptidase-like regulatory domain-containing protein [Pedobacter sp. AJM]|uniref:carboxypeptidase-like regulatory domain-containing protein n=1 Tax=Pedobacter sp. AJM TaxID=2003629 RepID=UPI000B4BBDE0|nr:carboxypeptidase-like regulatory domain-containing protein [Pedobacter sp. AJM]OWK68698.1 hypothetical protein CBW18_20835 [Pedobacter sp. AJM]
MKWFCVFFFLHIFIFTCTAQQFNLTGMVKDRHSEALPGAGIYVSGYKMATVSNPEGKFTMRLNPGNYDILVQLIGYKPLRKNVIIADQSINTTFTLEESVTQLAEVTIKPDPNREHYLNIFKDFFIGTTPNAKKCRLINPNVLIIDYEKEHSRLTVKTNQFLIIENKALGYQIKYLLNLFQFDYKSNIIYYEGFPYYDDLKGSSRQKRNWEKKRLIAYRGSPQHFFKSLYQKKAATEGFMINKLILRSNPEKPSDSMIQANIRRLSKKSIHSGTIDLNKDDSLNYWIRKKNLPAEIAILNRAAVVEDTLVRKVNANIRKINFTDKLFISYTKEKEDLSFSNAIGMSLSRPPDMKNHQASSITLQVSPLYFYENGGIYNPRSMLFSGYWAWEKIADSVPMDYMPLNGDNSTR